ncbi:SH2 domain-containing protein 2A [Ammospiza caudacuta]|uniref:SH2 domain-containing protein 2A n=1 Tax=Ammospiza caudacuta TaxID=2857398 RepID=UPI002739DDFF|nr:SH2 domain-containing protein 2A [Ammospiza caudacuta]
MDEDRPLFSTFKPLGEDSTARAKAGSSSTPRQAQGASEQPPGRPSRHGRVPPGFWAAPAAPSLPEDEERAALRARTRLWFEQTQARRLGPEGELPSWFHGFISRREAEELLQDQPLGCFLVRFSESTVGFVLSYRGRDRCRHFVLDQQPDGRYVILGERSAHPELAQLLQHHSTAPVSPYRELLSAALPCPRTLRDPERSSEILREILRSWEILRDPERSSERSWEILTDPERSWEILRDPESSLLSPQKEEPRGRPQGDAAHSPASQAAPTLPEHSPVSLDTPRAQAPPSLPAKSSSRGAARGLQSPSSSTAAPEAPYAQVQSPSRRAAAPEAPYAQVHKEPARPEPPEAKYQQLMCFHVYAEPREETDPSPTKPQEPIPGGPPNPEGPPIPEEPIPFYAMARGWSPRGSPEENIYSEVALAGQGVPARPPKAPQNAFSTLPPKGRPHRRLFRSVSSQDCRRRQHSGAPSRDREDRGAPSTGTQAVLSPELELELDDPVYSRSTPRDLQPTAENVYEQLPGDCS